MRALSSWEFDIYILSLPKGHGFGNQPPVKAWINDTGSTCGVLTKDINDGSYGILLMRRRVDHVWSISETKIRFSSGNDAYACLEKAVETSREPEPIPPSERARPALYDLQGREPSDVFRLLTRTTHTPAAWTLHQLYLALPKPDKNWASDCQTDNFHTRLWEAQLLACFREQGLLVTQPYESPDFRIENRVGGEAWVEAVTANPPVPYNHVNAPAVAIPATREELFFGPAALRFAKTLGNKLDRRYDKLEHVLRKPFMIAIADFQAPASMTWSREGLIGYLYGEGAQIEERNGERKAVAMPASHLLGPSRFPAGLFANDEHSELSAVIFSNACTIAKLNRVAVSGRGAPSGLRYTRIGEFFDRTPGALKPIPFCLDVTSNEYRQLWPHGYEPWCAELEVFYNPYARYPVPLELLPEVTHWFEKDGEQVCTCPYETSILWSQTRITDLDQRAPKLEDFMPGKEPET